MDYEDDECPKRGPALSHTRVIGFHENGSMRLFCGECHCTLYVRPEPVDPPFDVAARLEALGLTPWQPRMEADDDDEDDEPVNIHEEKYTDPDRWGRDRDTLSPQERRRLEFWLSLHLLP